MTALNPERNQEVTPVPTLFEIPGIDQVQLPDQMANIFEAALAEVHALQTLVESDTAGFKHGTFLKNSAQFRADSYVGNERQVQFGGMLFQHKAAKFISIQEVTNDRDQRSEVRIVFVYEEDGTTISNVMITSSVPIGTIEPTGDEMKDYIFSKYNKTKFSTATYTPKTGELLVDDKRTEVHKQRINIFAVMVDGAKLENLKWTDPVDPRIRLEEHRFWEVANSFTTDSGLDEPPSLDVLRDIYDSIEEYIEDLEEVTIHPKAISRQVRYDSDPDIMPQEARHRQRLEQVYSLVTKAVDTRDQLTRTETIQLNYLVKMVSAYKARSRQSRLSRAA